ncbi:type II toxin-antitoxin system VapC family toxin [Halosimplex pelagicum]|uniref:PIN domain-containing protein n=1 Tax=Halosimplex pelagicum TaxID=869886 RepID=A0A7D5P9X2_9EURY|nr:PIN domain-containing protein [Halosimplex pelagicum]QLH81082.1 PIN domain-containing protein [Halosimplex pelagicum]
MDRDEAAVAKLDEIVADGGALSVSTVSVTEVERGLGADERERFDTLLQDVDIRPYDRTIARRGADLLRSLDDRGEPIGALDAMVAATALEHDGRVVTRNVSEFRRVDGIRAVPY